MAVKIDSGALAATINDILDEYGDAAREAVEAAAKTTAKEVVKKLRQGGTYRGGEDFNKGWTSKTEKTRLGSVTTVYNKTRPQLAHLLEFGHATQNGGRTRAFNFIAPVADSVEAEFTAAFADEIKARQ